MARASFHHCIGSDESAEECRAYISRTRFGQAVRRGRATGPTEVSVQTEVLVLELWRIATPVTQERDPTILPRGHAGA
jgi:hypothetical protein